VITYQPVGDEIVLVKVFWDSFLQSEQNVFQQIIYKKSQKSTKNHLKS